MRWVAGIDIGGTNVKAVAAASDGTVLQRTSSATAATPAAWIAAARAVIESFSAACGSAPVAVGVCAPGLAADDERSIAHLPGKLPGLAGIDWTDALGQPRSVRVLNDGHAALLGEAWIGAARGRRHAVMLTLGTGIGGAVLADGRLLRGAMGRAGHIGHLSPRSGRPGQHHRHARCRRSVCRRLHGRGADGGRFQNTASLVAAHRAGDTEATRAWLKSVRALACAIGSCINLFDPEVVVIGGGIAQAGDALFTPLAAKWHLLYDEKETKVLPVGPTLPH
jgi:glucokinase